MTQCRVGARHVFAHTRLFRGSAKTPTGRLGDVSVQPTREEALRPQIPQPGGWGFFTLAWRKCGESLELGLE